MKHRDRNDQSLNKQHLEQCQRQKRSVLKDTVCTTVSESEKLSLRTQAAFTTVSERERNYHSVHKHHLQQCQRARNDPPKRNSMYSSVRERNEHSLNKQPLQWCQPTSLSARHVSDCATDCLLVNLGECSQLVNMVLDVHRNRKAY